MSDGLKDVIALATTLASLPLGFFQPVAAALLWGWLSFLVPHRVVSCAVFGVSIWWLPVVASLAGARRRRATAPSRSRELYLLLALWAFCALTTALSAVHPEIARLRLAVLSRILSLLLVVMAFAIERRRLTDLLWATALPLGAYALWGAAWVLWTGGVEPLRGPRATDAENVNDLAAMLLAVLPFFAYLGKASSLRLLRGGMLAVFALAVIAILGTYSRAGFLGLLVVLGLLLVRGERRVVLVAAAAFGVFLAAAAPQKFFARMATVATYQQESSAAKRPGEWYVALRIGLDHPWLGAGFRPFDRATYRRYVPDSNDGSDAHNVFLQVFAEHGFPGLTLYAALLGSTLWRLQRLASASLVSPDLEWSRDPAVMIQTGLLGFLVAGQFHCLSYRALLFDLLALAMILSALAGRVPGAATAPAPHS